MKEFADDNFKFDENGRKFSKGIENTVGKGEIAHYEQFLLFPQCFQKTYVLQTRKNQGLLGKGLNYHDLTVFLEGELLSGRTLLLGEIRRLNDDFGLVDIFS